MPFSKSHVFKHNNPKTNKIFPLQTWKTVATLKHAIYVKNLEREYDQLQTAFLQLTSQYARVQFRLRQLLQATPGERNSLIRELARVTFNDFEFLSEDEREEMPRLQHGNRNLGDIKRKQHEVIEKLRCQICNLQKVGTNLSTSYLENRAKQDGNCNPKYKSCSGVLNEIKSLNLICEDAPGVPYSELSRSNSSLANEHKSCNLPPVTNNGCVGEEETRPHTSVLQNVNKVLRKLSFQIGGKEKKCNLTQIKETVENQAEN